MTVIESALGAAADYLASLGVDDGDIDALLNDWDEDTANRVQELVMSGLPEGEEATLDSIDAFVFGKEGDAALDATYVKRVAIRHGKKQIIRKRTSGTVHLTGKQKLAIRKMQLKSHSATARAKRLKSVRIRNKMGL